MLPDPTALCRLHRHPAEIIAHAVWLYFRFNLSFRDVFDLRIPFDRGLSVSPDAAGSEGVEPRLRNITR